MSLLSRPMLEELSLIWPNNQSINKKPSDEGFLLYKKRIFYILFPNQKKILLILFPILNSMSLSQDIKTRYSFSGLSFPLGIGMEKWNIIPGAWVNLPLSTMNRHGLVAGATGTGKTKTLQKMIESLSKNGIPTIVMDIKGDISGLALSWEMNDKIQERLTLMSVSGWIGKSFPTEFYSLTMSPGVRLRATVSEYGPILFSRLLELNDTQQSVMALIFKYADDQWLLLIDLADIKKVLQYLSNEGKDEIEKEYGMISTSTVGTIMRKIIELESQGADIFFGEPSFDIHDFMRTDEAGKWYVNVIRLMDMMSRPKLFSTFMLSLLTEIYTTLPEVWDLEKPKLVLFIDEAHLIFENASPSLLQEIEMIIKLIRSKGVGIFFCTQNPIDIPPSILTQLGLKVQHALRAFTAHDREAIKRASENFPETPYYDVANDLTTLGIGEAFVTALDEKGIPTPLVDTMIAPPESRMGSLSDEELISLTSLSEIEKKYHTPLDPESAREVLEKKISEKLAQSIEANTPSLMNGVGGKIAKNVGSTLAAELGRTLGKSIGGRTGGTVGAQIARGLLGAIFGGR